MNDDIPMVLSDMVSGLAKASEAFRKLADKHRNARFSCLSVGTDCFVVTVETTVNTPTIQQWFNDAGMMVIRIDTTSDPVFVVYFTALPKQKE